MQTIEAVFQAADEMNAPIILDCVEMNDIEAVADITKFMALRYPQVDVALNLDHGKSFEVCAKAIQAGFTSVMIDCSMLPFEENVAITAEVTKMAHAVGVSVEAELGGVGSAQKYAEDRLSPFTDPVEAVEFVKRTSVDCLAVAVGTAHGLYKDEQPELAFDLIAELRTVVPVPLVLHGASGTGDDEMARAVQAGITKINLFSDLQGTRAVEEVLNSGMTTPLVSTVEHGLWQGVAAYKKMVMHYIEVSGSKGAAVR